MKNNKPDNDLNDQLKTDLREAKTKEELDALVSSEGMELDDAQLAEISGGIVSFPDKIPVLEFLVNDN